MIHHKIHHHVTRAIHHMRGRPEHHKHFAAVGVAIVATTFIATLWSVSFVHMLRSSNQNDGQPSVIGQSIDQIKKGIENSNLFSN
jgi:hypothetical protein